MTYKPKKSIHYKKSLLAYLDLIGFKEMVRESVKSNEKADHIYKLLQVQHHTTQIINKGKPSPPGEISELKATAFSDNIVLSLVGMTDEMFNSFVHVVAYFQWKSIDYYSFLRGAIVFGDNCQEGETVFGPALIKAYEMERKVAMWPRVVVDPQLIRLLSAKNRRHVFNVILSKGADGLPFVDFLRNIFLYNLGLGQEAPGTYETPVALPATFVFRQH